MKTITSWLLLLVAGVALCRPATADTSKNRPQTDAQKQAQKEWKKTNKHELKTQKKQTKAQKKAMKNWKKQHPEVRTVT